MVCDMARYEHSHSIGQKTLLKNSETGMIAVGPVWMYLHNVREQLYLTLSTNASYNR